MAEDPTPRYFEHFDHGADIGIRGAGPSLDAAFAEAAKAMTAAITDIDAVRDTTPVEISLAAQEPEDLFFAWLNALVFEMATRGMLFRRFDITITEDGLHATAWGEDVDRQRHEPAVEVKGPTYTGLKIRHQPGGPWIAECVIDV